MWTRRIKDPRNMKVEDHGVFYGTEGRHRRDQDVTRVRASGHVGGPMRLPLFGPYLSSD